MTLNPHLAGLTGVLVVLAKPVPVGPPRLDDDRILFTPSGIKGVEVCLGQRLAACPVDLLKVAHDKFVYFKGCKCYDICNEAASSCPMKAEGMP